MEYPVYILDNNETFLKLLLEVLKDEFIVIGTHNTNEFINEITQPAVLLIDWYLDYGVIGMSVMERVRKANPLTHVIYISNLASKDVLLSVVNEGWGCYFIEKDTTDFFTDLRGKIKKAKALLREKIAVTGTELKQNELLKERISETLKVIELNGRTY